MPPLADKPRWERSDLASNVARLFVFLVVQGLVIAIGIGLLAAMHAADTWFIAWTVLALLLGSLAGSYLLFPGALGTRLVQSPEPTTQAAGEYRLVNIYRLLLDAFTPDSLRQLVYSEPALIEAAKHLGSRYSHVEMVETIVAWATRHGQVRELIAAAQRANPAMVALHGPYGTEEREPPAKPIGDRTDILAGYNLANIRRLLVQGFSADDLYRLVGFEPALNPLAVEFQPGASVPEMADTIIEWGRSHMTFAAILAAAERANPRRYAVHRPYHAQDRDQPQNYKAYHLGRIAALCEDVFEAPALYHFLHARAALQPVWTAISPQDNLARMIYRALATAERQVLVDELLLAVRAAHPEAYARFEPYEQDPRGPGAEAVAEEERPGVGGDETVDSAGGAVGHE